MDERILTIIKSMAMGYLAEDDQGYRCLHCDVSATNLNPGKELHHKQDCPVLLARQWLHEKGTPMKLYKMTGSSCYTITKLAHQWQSFTAYTLAISEQEAINNWTNEHTRNLQAVFVRELPL